MTAHPFKQFREAQTPPMSKAELARLLKTSRASVTRYEQGRVPERSLWPVIEARTGIKPARLLGLEPVE